MADVIAKKLITELVAKNADFKKKMKESVASVTDFSKKIEKNKDAIQKVGKGFAAFGAGIVGSLGLAVNEAANFGDMIDKMSGRTGEAAETLSGFFFAAQRGGADLGTVEVAFRRLQKNMKEAGDGMKISKEAFEAVGIEIRDVNGNFKSGAQVMIEFADKTKGMEDATLKGALAQDIFGRAGTKLLPMLNEGGDAIKALK